MHIRLKNVQSQAETVLMLLKSLFDCRLGINITDDGSSLTNDFGQLLEFCQRRDALVLHNETSRTHTAEAIEFRNNRAPFLQVFNAIFQL